MFNSIEEITNHAVNNVEYEKIEEFIKEENKRLNQPIPEDLLQKVIEKALESTNPTDDPRYHWKKLQSKCSVENLTLKAVKNFIETEMISTTREDVIEEFIITLLKKELNLKRDEVNNLKKFVKELKKQKISVKAIIKASNPQNELSIDHEFEGLYEISISPKGEAYAIPKVDAIAERVVQNLHVIVYMGNCFCFKNGYYRNDLATVKSEAIRILNGICNGTKSNGINKKLADVMVIIQNTKLAYEYPFNRHANAIPVKNGVVVMDFKNKSIELEPHNPEKFKFNYMLNVKFDANLTSSAIIDELKKYTPEFVALIQAPAQALLQAMGYGPYKKAYILQGEKNCGKSTYLDIIGMLIGDENISRVSLEELNAQNRFALAGLEGKIMNLKDDMGYFNIKETGKFKEITGISQSKIEHKGVDGYNALINAVHMFTTNTPAGFDRRIFLDDAFWSRCCYIEFRNVFSKNDEFKINLLTEENISAFFNDVLKTVLEIKANNGLIFEQTWVDVRERWLAETNILYKFLEENMVYGGKTAIIKDNLKEILNKFGQEKRYDGKLIPEDAAIIGNLVELCGGTRDAQRSFEGTNTRVTHCFILNYVWKPFSEYCSYAKKEVTEAEWEQLKVKKEEDIKVKAKKKAAVREATGNKELDEFSTTEDILNSLDEVPVINSKVTSDSDAAQGLREEGL